VRNQAVVRSDGSQTAATEVLSRRLSDSKWSGWASVASGAQLQPAVRVMMPSEHGDRQAQFYVIESGRSSSSTGSPARTYKWAAQESPDVIGGTRPGVHR